MTDEQDIKRRYVEFYNFLNTLAGDMGRDVAFFEENKIRLPSYQQARDSELLYTRLYEVTNTLDRLNRRLSSLYMARSTSQRLRHNSSVVEFGWKLEMGKRVESLFSVLSGLESALLSYKDTLDKQFKTLNSAQFMIHAERYNQPIRATPKGMEEEG